MKTGVDGSEPRLFSQQQLYLQRNKIGTTTPAIQQADAIQESNPLRNMVDVEGCRIRVVKAVREI